MNIVTIDTKRIENVFTISVLFLDRLYVTSKNTRLKRFKKNLIFEGLYDKLKSIYKEENIYEKIKIY